MNRQIKRGCVVSFPDLFEKRDSRSGVIVAKSHFSENKFILAPLTGDSDYEDHPLTVSIEADETVYGELEKDSYFEPWRTTNLDRHEVDGPFARLSKPAMKRVAKSYVKMSFDGYDPE